MLCAVIIGPTLIDAQTQIIESDYYTNLYEFRLDLIQYQDVNDVRFLLNVAKHPVIFTLRCAQQGGAYNNSEEERLLEIKKLAALEPAYLDIEYTVDPSFYREMRTAYPTLQIICSYHNFKHTPTDLDALFITLQKMPAHVIKIATVAHSSIDALRMLKFVRQVSIENAVVGLCMGAYGELTRILGCIYGNLFCYAAVNEFGKSASGQLSLDTLIETYHHHLHTPQTNVLGLIGGTTQYSVSHYTHNQLFRQLNINAVYVKIDIQPHELSEFMALAYALKFIGLSVTMPLKEYIVALIPNTSAIVQKIGALNTLIVDDGQYYGTNTDGIGAVQALLSQTLLATKKIVIIGAGGTAKAIAYELLKEKSTVVIINRNVERAQEAAHMLGCKCGSLEDFSSHSDYNILINCTPVGRSSDNFPLLINPDSIISGTIVMDVIVSDEETSFHKEAKKRNCRFISGKEMFKFQATAQFHKWFELKNSPAEMAEFFNHALYHQEISTFRLN